MIKLSRFFPSIFLVLNFFINTINSQVSTSLINSVNRKIKQNTVNSLLTYYLTPRQLQFLSQHGCWCAKIIDPENNQGLGGSADVDDLDIICKHWQLATKCIHTLGQNCFEYEGEELTDIFIKTDENGLQIQTQCDIDSNAGDACLIDACKVHTYFADKIATFINNESYVLFHGSEEYCRHEF